MASSINQSYSYQNLIRDLTGMINMTIQSQPVFLSLVPVSSQFATHTKHEWLEDKLTPQQDTTGASATNVATSLTVTTAGAYKNGDVWLNVRTEERFLVTAGGGTTTLTITRGLGNGGTGVAMNNADVLRLVARPQDEGTDPGEDAGHEALPASNYTQILDRTAKISRTAQNVKMYGVENAMDREVMLQLDSLSREMNQTAIWGVKQQRTGNTAATKGRAGGLYEFLDQVGANRIDAAAGALTKVMVNDLLQQCFINGAGDLALLCGPKQARAITALDANYQIVRGDMTAGKAILQYQGDMAGNNASHRIVVDPTYSAKRVDAVDLSRVSQVWLEGSALKDEDARTPGGDYLARRILGEWTLEVKNAKEAHGSIYNLA